MTAKLVEKFQELFGAEGDIRTYFAPGRVKLIGEHTDYNGGHVFPCALTLGTYGIARKREDNKLRFYSVNFERLGVIESSLEDLKPYKAAEWTNYPKGVMWAFEERGYKLPNGLDILLYGNIPNGSGLSSSASLEVLTGVILKDMFGFDVSMTDIALIGQFSENNFNGCNCGIMDQFASAMGKKDNAIFLDTNTLQYEYAPVVLEDAKIVIINSKVKHSLVDSAYNDRRNECETALKELQEVVAESHRSLRDDYEVSCKEIDILVDLAWETEGVIGSRITGGGFGGCTVSIVKNDAVDGFIKNIGEQYLAKVGHEAEFYVVDIGDGARVLNG